MFDRCKKCGATPRDDRAQASSDERPQQRHTAALARRRLARRLALLARPIARERARRTAGQNHEAPAPGGRAAGERVARRRRASAARALPGRRARAHPPARRRCWVRTRGSGRRTRKRPPPRSACSRRRKLLRSGQLRGQLRAPHGHRRRPSHWIPATRTTILMSIIGGDHRRRQRETYARRAAGDDGGSARRAVDAATTTTVQGRQGRARQRRPRQA